MADIVAQGSSLAGSVRTLADRDGNCAWPDARLSQSRAGLNSALPFAGFAEVEGGTR